MEPLSVAYCKNSVDGLWYCFDDSDVQQLSEDEVCTQTAYILFYQRRTAIPSWSANSSVAGKAGPPWAASLEWTRVMNGLEKVTRPSQDSGVSPLTPMLACNLEARSVAARELG